MPRFDSKQFELKRARDKEKLAQIQKEIAGLESYIVNARGFRAKSKIKKAQKRIAKLRPYANALIAQMQLEDARIERARIEEEDRIRKEKEKEKRRQKYARRTEERRKELEEKERLEAERWASLTPEEQKLELSRKRKTKTAVTVGFVALVLLCGGWMINLIFMSQDEIRVPDDVSSVAINPATSTLTNSPSRIPTNPPKSTNTPKPTQTPKSTNTSTPTSTPSPLMSVTVLQGANLRAGPGSDFDVVGGADANEVLPVYGRSANSAWLLVSHTEPVWIWVDLVELPEEISVLPVPTSGTSINTSTNAPTAPTSELYDVEEVFRGWTPFPYAVTELMVDPDDILAGFVPVDIDTIVPNRMLYRFYYAERQPPVPRYQDICPGKFDTLWFTFDVDDNEPMDLGFWLEIRSENQDYPEWYSPIYMDEHRDAAGHPSFFPPVYLVACLDPDNSHISDTFADSEPLDSSRTFRCKIHIVRSDGSVVESINLLEESESVAYCDLDD